MGVFARGRAGGDEAATQVVTGVEGEVRGRVRETAVKETRVEDLL